MEPRNPRRNYEIHFARGQERVLDHLIAHKVGHLVRFHQVPEDERLIPVAADETRRRAAEQVATEILPHMAVGLPEQALSKVLSAWYEGVCTQLVSFPTDLRIEQWTVSQAFGQSSAAL